MIFINPYIYAIASTGWTPNYINTASGSGLQAYYKNAGGNSWNGYLWSTEGYANSLSCSFQVQVASNASTINTFFGVGPSTYTSSLWPYYTWQISQPFGCQRVSIAGNHVYDPTSDSYAANDTFAVYWDGTTIRWLKNGTQLYTSSLASGTKQYLQSVWYQQPCTNTLYNVIFTGT